ncbi:hypothetical protein ACFLQL_00350 [Verrucomicrobiota bacterium]
MILDHGAIREALKNPESSATLIHSILKAKYDDAVYYWDPLTIYLEVKDDFDVDMPDAVLNKLAAVQILMTTDAFFKRIDAFIPICNTFNSGEPFFIAFDPATTEEIAWTLAEVALNREYIPFSYAIKKYIKITLAQDGYAEENSPDTILPALDEKFNPDAFKGALKSVTNNPNKDEIELYVDDKLTDIVREFDKIPDLPKGF